MILYYIRSFLCIPQCEPRDLSAIPGRRREVTMFLLGSISANRFTDRQAFLQTFVGRDVNLSGAQICWARRCSLLVV